MSGFWNKIKRLFRSPTKPQYRPPTPRPRAPAPTQMQRLPTYTPPKAVPPTQPSAGPLSYDTILDTIAKAGKSHLTLSIKYNGTMRLVDPYSIREQPTGRLFFGLCHTHGKIHSFKPEKIEYIEITNQTFSPLWAVEF
jgi:hypothetical protein